MSLKPISIATAAEPAFDQRQLYLRGLEHIRRLAHATWTDHNVHDPGITTLELLAYALTDLSYRARWPLEDLLAVESGDNSEHMRRQFYSARRILPNRARTSLDFRKLVIDLPGVQNAWILPAPLTFIADLVEGELRRDPPAHAEFREVHVRGLYRVLVEYAKDVTDETRAAIDARALERLHAHRNLCEDFVAVDRVGVQRFRVCGELELAPDADTARVMAMVLDEVQRYLAPPVTNYTLAEMLQRRKPDGTPYSVPEIFDGPALDCGFIDNVELEAAGLRTEVRLSDVISLIMDIAGVRAVRDLTLHPTDLDTPDSRWVVPVAPGMQPVLDVGESRLVLHKRGIPVAPDSGEVERIRREAAEAARAMLETANPEDVPIPLGTYRRPDRYYSFQNHFPAVYGVGEAGLPPESDDKRRAWRRAVVHQLKAYLLFFDQVMANYCAQLAHVADLFSTDAAKRRTYFSQMVTSFPAHEDIYTTDIAALQDLVEAIPGLPDRRQRFLDHQIARVAERFHEYVQIVQSLFGASADSLIVDRCEFLKDYPELGAGRGLGYNYSLAGAGDVWDSANVSGLEKRVGRLIGLANLSRRSLSPVVLDAHAAVTGNPTDQFRFEVRHRDTNDLLLSSATTSADEAGATTLLRAALERGQLRSGYETASSGSDHTFSIVQESGDPIAVSPAFTSAADRDKNLSVLIEYLRDHYTREGMYVVENVLIRPAEESDPFLPICVDPDCVDCADDDPYSYRIHVILPAYAGRFRHMDFRRFVEEVIREETPAHVLPKVCWISEAAMARFEAAYETWLEIRSGGSVGDRAAALDTFVRELYALKNVYPVQKLAPCAAPEAEPKFILGQTALGSADDLDD